MNRYTLRRLGLSALIAVAIVVTTVRCSDDRSLPAGVTSESARTSHNARARAPITSEAVERAKRALAKGAWAGDVHRLAMTDLIGNRGAWRSIRRRGPAEVCAVAWRLAEKYAPAAARHIGPNDSRHARKAPEVLQAKLGCPAGSASPFERWLAARTNQLSLFRQDGLPPGVTGEYEQYGLALENAYFGASTASQAATATYDVVNQAAANGLGQPDLDYLALIASVSVSSAYQWYDYEVTGGFDQNVQNPLSLFQSMALSRWGRIGVADLGGALMGSRGGFWWAVAGGVVASSVTAINTA